MKKRSKTITSKDIEIGRRIKIRRKAIRMSQSDLGNALGVTFQQVQKYENGANRVASGRLQEIAQKLQCPMSYFFDGMTADGVPEATSFFDTREAVELTQSFAKIKSSKMRAALLELARVMAAGK